MTALRNFDTELDVAGVVRMVVPTPLPTLVISPTPDQVSGEGTLQEQFEQFHADNPWVYDTLVRMTRQMRSRGVGKIGMGQLFEVLRWHHSMTTMDANSEFKLNNNYRSRYSRLIMESETDLLGVYEIRRLRAE